MIYAQIMHNLLRDYIALIMHDLRITYAWIMNKLCMIYYMINTIIMHNL